MSALLSVLLCNFTSLLQAHQCLFNKHKTKKSTRRSLIAQKNSSETSDSHSMQKHKHQLRHPKNTYMHTSTMRSFRSHRKEESAISMSKACFKRSKEPSLKEIKKVSRSISLQSSGMFVGLDEMWPDQYLSQFLEEYWVQTESLVSSAYPAFLSKAAPEHKWENFIPLKVKKDWQRPAWSILYIKPRQICWKNIYLCPSKTKSLPTTCGLNTTQQINVIQNQLCFPAPSSKLCQNWLHHWQGTPYTYAPVYRCYQHPPKGLSF